MKFKRQLGRLSLLFTVIGSLLAQSVLGAGVTIITHGNQLISGQPTWVNAMSDAIVNRIGGNVAVFDMVLGMDLSTGKPAVQYFYPRSGNTPFSYDSEIVIRVFWDQVAGEDYDFGCNCFKIQAVTRDVALVIEPYISQVVSGIGASIPFAQLPIHLIGHSRGGSVMSELARILGQKGIWVNQLTTLDPRFVQGDASVNVWKTVLFADNYYEEYTLTVPVGVRVDGAVNENLTDRLPGGYGDLLSANHSDVHLWYHGTIATGAGAYDGTVNFTGAMRNPPWYASYEYGGQVAGFYYSRLGGGAYALDGFLDGYNDGGHNLLPAARVSLTRSASEWPSFITLINNASGSVQAGNAFPLHCIFESYDSGASVTLFLDSDQNPYNGNEIALTLPAINPQPATGLTTRALDVNATVPSSTPPGFYYVYGKINNPNGTRYLYARLKVQVVTAATVAAATVTSVSPSTLPPSFSTQLINIYGSNFKASGDPNASTLIFRDPANIAYVRTPIFVSSSQLQYNITVQSAVGTWSVTVTNAGQAASNLKTFLVETPTPNTGSVTVNITPAGAVSAGAQWRVDSGSYLNNGDVATSVLPGSHTVSFKSVSGYNTPASLTLNIVANQQATVNAIYSAIANCNYSLSSSGDTWAAAGGGDAFSVLTSAGCAWTATENLSWVSITSGSSGVGSHSVGYQVDYNSSTSPRSGVINAGGQYFNVYQNGNQLACTFSFSSPGANFESGGGSGSFSISTAAICDWEANTNANWVSITSGKSGTGSGSIQYAVQANPGSSSRTATITAGGQTFTVVQAGAPLPPGTIATGLSNPTEIALDQDFVYWIEYRAKIVKRASKLGGQELLLASSSFNPKGIAVDDSFVYYFDGGSQLLKVPKAGGAPVLLASSVSPERITLDAARVYWTEFSGNVKSIAKTGGAVTTEATGTYAAAGIRVDNDAIYWSCFNNPGPLYKKLKSGGDKTALYSSGDTTVGVALDTNLVFWTTSDAIWRISPDGSGRSAVKSGLRYVWDLAFDGTNLFWTENTTSPRGTINQVLKQGGSFINLATNLAEPVSIAVDSQKVFWLERNGGTTGSGSLKWIAKGVVQADTIAPQVMITNPPDAARFNDPALNVSGIASDDTGVATVELRLNGGSWQAASGTTNWNLSVSLVVSNNTIEARSRDNAGNYSPLGTVTVTYIPPDAKLPQAIAFGALSKQVFGDAPFALSATASSGLPVSFSVLSGPAVLSGNILTITGAGLVVLRASQPGDATYTAAPNVDQVLIVVPGNNVITDAQRLANGMFTLRYYGDTGTNYIVKASTNLVNWLPLATNQISGLGYLEFIDISSTNFDRRFYRIAP